MPGTLIDISKLRVRLRIRTRKKAKRLPTHEQPTHVYDRAAGKIRKLSQRT